MTYELRTRYSENKTLSAQNQKAGNKHTNPEFLEKKRVPNLQLLKLEKDKRLAYRALIEHIRKSNSQWVLRQFKDFAESSHFPKLINDIYYGFPVNDKVNELNSLFIDCVNNYLTEVQSSLNLTPEEIINHFNPIFGQSVAISKIPGQNAAVRATFLEFCKIQISKTGRYNNSSVLAHMFADGIALHIFHLVNNHICDKDRLPEHERRVDLNTAMLKMSDKSGVKDLLRLMIYLKPIDFKLPRLLQKIDEVCVEIDAIKSTIPSTTFEESLQTNKQNIEYGYDRYTRI